MKKKSKNSTQKILRKNNFIYSLTNKINMDLLFDIILLCLILIFYTIGHFIKKYKTHHEKDYKKEIEPVFTELYPEEQQKKKTNKILGHKKIKTLIRKK